jgi:hypothetical protein
LRERSPLGCSVFSRLQLPLTEHTKHKENTPKHTVFDDKEKN